MEFLKELFVFILTFTTLIIPGTILFFYKLLAVCIGKVKGLSPVSGIALACFQFDREVLFKRKNGIWCQNFGFILKFENESTKININQIRNLFEERIIKNKVKNKFWSLVSYPIEFMGYVFMKPIPQNNINLNKLIVEVILSSDQQLEIYLQNWSSEPYEPKQPLWKMKLIHHNSQMYLALKSHHLMTDAYSLYHILDELTGNFTKYQVKDYDDTFLSKIHFIIKAPLTLFNEFGAMANLHDCGFMKFDQSTAVPGSLAFSTLPLQKIKIVRRILDVKFHTILTSLLYTLLREISEMKNLSIPRMIPILESWPLPRHPYRKRIENHATVIRSEILTNEEITRIDRILQIYKSEMKYTEKSLQRVVASSVSMIYGYVPRYFLKKMSSPVQCEASLSTAILSTNKYELLGRKVEKIHTFPGMMVPSSGLGMKVVSEGDNLNFTLVGRSDYFTPQELKTCSELIQIEFEKIYEEVNDFKIKSTK